MKLLLMLIFFNICESRICVLTREREFTEIGICNQDRGFSICEGKRYINATSDCVNDDLCLIFYKQPTYSVGYCFWKFVNGTYSTACKRGKFLDPTADCS